MNGIAFGISQFIHRKYTNIQIVFWFSNLIKFSIKIVANSYQSQRIGAFVAVPMIQVGNVHSENVRFKVVSSRERESWNQNCWNISLTSNINFHQIVMMLYDSKKKLSIESKNVFGSPINVINRHTRKNRIQKHQNWKKLVNFWMSSYLSSLSHFCCCLFALFKVLCSNYLNSEWKHLANLCQWQWQFILSIHTYSKTFCQNGPVIGKLYNTHSSNNCHEHSSCYEYFNIRWVKKPDD